MLHGNIQNTNTAIHATVLTNNGVKATEKQRGSIRIATENEALEGKSSDTAITPKTLKKILDDYNVLSGDIVYEIIEETEEI